MSLLVKFKTSRILKLVTQVLHDRVDSFLMILDDNGMSFQCIDGASVAFSTFSVPVCDFITYKCPHRVTLGLKMEYLFKVFKRVHAEDPVTLSRKEGEDLLTIRTGSISATDTTKLVLMDIDVESLDCNPAFTHYVTMSSAVFRSMCEKMLTFGETVVVKITEEDVTFSTKGDMGETSMTFNTLVEKDKPQVAIDIQLEDKQPITCSFGSKYMKEFSDSYAISDKVVLELAQDFPIGLLYRFYTKSQLCHYISPKIQDETAE